MNKVFRNKVEKRSMPTIGKIVKGKKTTSASGKQIPTDLEYFRFLSSDPTAHALFTKYYGDKPQEISVRLVYSTVKKNCDVWMEEWSAGGLKTRCDGDWIVDPTNDNKPYMPCKSTPEEDCKCKSILRMLLILPKFRRLAYVTLETRSPHDISRIRASLQDLEDRGIKLNEIPFVIRRTPCTISKPTSTGRTQGISYLLSIEPDPEWAQREIKGIQDGLALPEPQEQSMDLLPVPEDEDEDPESTVEVVAVADEDPVQEPRGIVLLEMNAQEYSDKTIQDLIQISDQLMADLDLSATKAREILKGKWNKSSRQQLDREQLIEFILLLQLDLNTRPVHKFRDELP